MWRLLVPALVGFGVGVFWLLAIGIPGIPLITPEILPSWLDLRDRAAVREAAAEGQAAAFDESEANRETENVTAIGDVEGERGVCEARLAVQARGYERSIAATIEFYQERINDPDAVPDRAIRPVERVFGDDP